MHGQYNEYNLLVKIQTLHYSAVELVFVYERSLWPSQTSSWLPGPRTAAEGGPVCGEERAVKHYKTENAKSDEYFTSMTNFGSSRSKLPEHSTYLTK